MMKIRLLLVSFILIQIQLHAQWSTFCSGNTDGFVVDFAKYNDTIFSTGFFHTICDADAAYVAGWDGSNWNAVGTTFEQEGHAIDSLNGQLYASLYQFTTDSNYVYTYNGAAWSKVGNGVYQNNPGPGFPKNASIYDIIEYDGKIIASGDFDIAGDVVVNGIMQWDGTSWLPLGEGLTEFIPGMPSILYPHNMTIFNGDLIVAGNFYKAGGIIVNGIARWDGTTWHAMGDGFNQSVYAVGVFNDELYAGGEFTMSGTNTMHCIAKWNGSEWINPGFEVAYEITGLHEFVHTLRAFNGKLFITGGFDQLIIDGVTSAAGSILAYDGTSIDKLEGGVAGEIEAIIAYENGVLVAGDFSAAGGIPAENFAVYQYPDIPVKDYDATHVLIYPNPAHDQIFVELQSGALVDIIVSDMRGNIIYTKPACNSITINMSGFASGCYVIKVKNAENVFSSLIFVE